MKTACARSVLENYSGQSFHFPMLGLILTQFVQQDPFDIIDEEVRQAAQACVGTQSKSSMTSL